MSTFSSTPDDSAARSSPSKEYEDLVADQVNLVGEARPAVYRTAPPVKRDKPKLPETLPDIGSAILASPEAQKAFAGFGVDGLKTHVLQALIKLGGRALDDEMATLLAADDPVVRRALRATKLLALQWLEDSRQAQDVRLKCQSIFDRIPTFTTNRLQEPPPAVPTASGLPPAPPLARRVGAIAGVDLQPGDRLHVFTDIKGDYTRLKRLLRTHRLVDAADNWIAGPEDYLLLVGDLLAGSRFDAWGDVGTQSFAVIDTVRRLAANGGMGIAAGPTDMSVAKRTFFRHPRFGYSAPDGQARFAQGLAWARDFLAATAHVDPHHPYAAWQISEGFFKLKSSHQLLNLPYIELWASGDKPDVSPLLETLDRLVDGVCQGQWPTPQALEQEIPTMLPIGTDDLAYADAREALVEGLLQGTGVIDFFRQSLAAQWRFRGGDQVYKVHYAGIDALAVSQWGACKELGWQLLSLPEFLEQKVVFPKLQLPRLQQILASVGITNVPELVTWDGEAMAQRAQDRRAIDGLCQTLGLRRDRAGFVEDWEAKRTEWIRLEAGGLAGAELGGGKGAMTVLGPLDEKGHEAYANKVWSDIFGEPAPFTREPDGTIHWQTPKWHGWLRIDESVKVVRDALGRVQVPMKHALTLQYVGDPAGPPPSAAHDPTEVSLPMPGSPPSA